MISRKAPYRADGLLAESGSKMIPQLPARQNITRKFLEQLGLEKRDCDLFRVAEVLDRGLERKRCADCAPGLSPD